MINIDTRLLTSEISDGELRLLMTIASFINENMKAWPSNAKILERTGWSLGKLQLTKKALEEKGLLKIESRHRDNAQTSNVYTLNCPLIGVYVQANKIKLEEQEGYQKSSRGDDKNKIWGVSIIEQGGYQKSSNEVLTNEVLTNEVLINNNTVSANAQRRVSSSNLKPSNLEEEPLKERVHRADVLQKSVISGQAVAEHLGLSNRQDLIKAFDAYLDYRKEMRFKRYATVQTAALAMKFLKTCAERSNCTPMEIVDQTRANLWQGMQDLKRAPQPKQKTNEWDGKRIPAYAPDHEQPF